MDLRETSPYNYYLFRENASTFEALSEYFTVAGLLDRIDRDTVVLIITTFKDLFGHCDFRYVQSSVIRAVSRSRKKNDRVL